MISVEEINRYPELHDFINAESTAERELYAKQLRSSYLVMNDISMFRENLSPIGIIAGLGLPEHFKILERVEHLLFTQEIPQALMKAIQGGQLNIVHYLLEQDLTQLNRSSIYSSLLMAIRTNSSAIFNRLLDMYKFEQMLIEKSSEIFTHACRILNNPLIIKKLLSYSSCFSLANKNESICNPTYLLEFIRDKLSALHELESHQLHAHECVFYFYVLKTLIRTSSSLWHDEIKFLLQIPTVRALVHTEITLGQPNELFRLALSVQNYSAEKALSLIPAVIKHAEQNHFYGDEEALIRHKNRRMQFEASVSCITMLQALYPARRSMPRLFENDRAAHIHYMYRKTFITEILGHVFSYLTPPRQMPSVKENMDFVIKAKTMLLAQDSRLFHHAMKETETAEISIDQTPGHFF
jgi:hypothetical protein